MNISFFNFQLTINDKEPTLEDLQYLYSKGEKIPDSHRHGHTYEIVEREKINDNYFWMYIKYGSQYPYGDTVVDKETKEEADNPRLSNQIEMNHQIFILYSLEKHTLYISDRQQKNFLQKYLEDQLKKEINIKSYMVDVDEFLKTISTINKIKLVSKSGMFSSHYNMNDIVPSSNDIFGLENPGTYEIKATFQKEKITERFKDTFRKLFSKNKNHEIDSLICVGTDDNGVDNIFNMDSLVQKLQFECSVNEYKQYDSNEIKNEIIKKLNT